MEERISPITTTPRFDVHLLFCDAAGANKPLGHVAERNPSIGERIRLLNIMANKMQTVIICNEYVPGFTEYSRNLSPFGNFASCEGFPTMKPPWNSPPLELDHTQLVVLDPEMWGFSDVLKNNSLSHQMFAPEY